jgi:hypothetical protein
MRRSMIRSVFSLLFVAASAAYATVPSMSVVVSDASGKAAYKGATDANGTFATASLAPGNYVVQFNCKSAHVRGKNFGLVISAGKKKVTADSVEGDKFAAGGVAMRIELGGSQSITGQVTDAFITKLDKNGKRLVWIPKKLGSNLPAHWAAEDSAEAKEAQTQTSYSTKNIQDRQAQGASPQ